MKNLFWYRNVRPEEREADLFATELVMPELFFQPLCDEGKPNFQLIEELAKLFKSSLTATAIRYMEFCAYTCALVSSQNGQINMVIGSESFNTRVRGGVREGTLDQGTYASSFTKTPDVGSAAMKKKLARCWLKDQRYADGKIWEQSRNLGN